MQLLLFHHLLDFPLLQYLQFQFAPMFVLRKILQTLNRKGLLRSYKGKGGGFKLAVGPDRIFLLDLIKVFQGPLKINECTFKKEICPNVKICPLKEKLDSIEKYVISQLEPVTIASLLKKGERLYGKKENNKDR